MTAATGERADLSEGLGWIYRLPPPRIGVELGGGDGVEGDAERIDDRRWLGSPSPRRVPCPPPKVPCLPPRYVTNRVNYQEEGGQRGAR